MSNIYKVAKLAGVSPKTAARILAGESQRSKHRQAVFDAAKELGYARNQQAANLRSGSTSVIGIIVPDINNPFYGKVIQSMHDACLKHGFSILLASSFGRPEEEARAMRTLQSYRVDGVMLNASEHPVGKESLKICRHFIEQGKPVVLSGEIEEKLPGADRVVIGNELAVSKAVRYLQSQGHERIGFIGGFEDSRAIQQRHAGYVTTLKECDLPLLDEYTIYTNGDMAQVGSKVTDTMLKLSKKVRPTAFIAGNDIIAISALKAFDKLSLKVPADVAVIGFDGIDLSEMVTPSLTTLRQPQTQIASDVVQLMVQRIKGETTIGASELHYEPELIIRDST
ncbi:LacI family DNA-binding transcriptional regulator [Kiritimatiellaeota bacterium B1221]|nr:LacI family DNA-binding transcriptional regulator [Kiritimatiellaeota bacterium B1221]